MKAVERADHPRSLTTLRLAIAAMAVCVGLAVAPAQGLAWAEPATTGSTAAETTQTDSTAENPDSPTPDASPSGTGRLDPDTDTDTDDLVAVADSEGDETSAEAEVPTEVTGADEPETAPEPEPEPQSELESDPEQDVVEVEPEPAHGTHVIRRPEAPVRLAEHAQESAPAQSPATTEALLTAEAQTASHEPAAARSLATPEDTGTAALVAVTDAAAVDTTAPTAPEPLSPLAKLLRLPGHLINAVLQVFDITASANGPGSPINLAPINDLLFAAFREWERLIGLDRTPAVQPAVPTLTYSGPTTAPTPTVAQFLNASTAAYGLGTTPGGLVPFTVNGFQMSSTNILSGEVGRAWVTPERQIIIAYQGTTGGTNLLFNPFIAVTQLLTDLQVSFTRTTPWAFYDAVRFARRVQAEAAEQGYAPDDIFVTGHSLGGWEAQYVAQQIGLAGIGFETPGINTVVPGNGADSMFVNIETYGDMAPLISTDLPGLQPFMPPYVPGGGSRPHYGSIVMIGDPTAMTPVYNAAALWGKGPIRSIIAFIDILGNFFQYHLPGVQAHHLDVTPDPGVVPWLGKPSGSVDVGYGTLTIPQLLKSASDAGTLFRP